MVQRELHSKKGLFLQISENNHEAFETLFSLYKARLFKYSFQLLKSHAEADEVVQEVFVKLWLKRDILPTVEEPDQFVFTILRNIALDKLRRIAADKRLRQRVWQRTEAISNTTENTVLADEGDKLIAEAFGKLSPNRQVIYQLSRHEGLSHDQIAERLKISKNTVKNQIVSSLKFIRKYLSHHFTAFLLFLVD